MEGVDHSSTCIFPGPRDLFAELDLPCPDPVVPLSGLGLHIGPSPFKELGYILHKDFELRCLLLSGLMELTASYMERLSPTVCTSLDNDISSHGNWTLE